MSRKAPADPAFRPRALADPSEAAFPRIEQGIDWLTAHEPAFGRVVAAHGRPSFRLRRAGFPGMVATILGQQVSTAAAASMWTRLEAVCTAGVTPSALAALDEATLRACGFSRQKIGYARALSAAVLEGRLDLDSLHPDDETAIAALTALPGIGRWTAECHLLFTQARPDVFPAGDLALLVGLGLVFGTDKPTETAARARADAWRPWRSAATLLAWQAYLHRPRPVRPEPASKRAPKTSAAP